MDQSSAPVPLSFPALLRNPQLIAHLHLADKDTQLQPRQDRGLPEGKRWARRRENAKFSHNPHITPPTATDFSTPPPLPATTFPIPLPPYLPRSVVLPPSVLPPPNPAASAAGLFFLSLRGVRRAFRARPASASLVQAVESHLINWLQGSASSNPDEGAATDSFVTPGEPVGGRDDVREVSRETARLVWVIHGADGGGFERYVVHCVSRWHNVVSFSKEVDGRRLTFLLRPNSTRPVPSSPATPSATDASDLSVSDVNASDLNTTDASDLEMPDTSEYDACDVDPVASPTRHRILATVSEAPSVSPPTSPSWSIISRSVDQELTASIESLSVADAPHQGSVPSPVSTGDAAGAAPVRCSARTALPRGSLRRATSSSSSSPSPARRAPRRPHISRRLERRCAGQAAGRPLGMAGRTGLFYDYLFA